MFEWLLANLNGTTLSTAVIGLSIWLYKVQSNQQRSDKSLSELQEWVKEHEKEVTMAIQEFTTYKANQENLEEKVQGLQTDIKEALDKIDTKLDLLNQKVWSTMGRRLGDK